MLQIKQCAGEIRSLYQKMDSQDRAPLSFYLIVTKRNGQEQSKQVYTSPHDNYIKFIEFLNMKDACRLAFHEPARQAKSYSMIKSKDSGIFVLPIQPKRDFLFSDGAMEFTAVENFDTKD